jgi:nucleoside-diphosphate-sugar epimerase
LEDLGDIDHPGCAAAILQGLSNKEGQSFLIHLTGTGCISDEREQTWEGKYNPHVWNDIEEIKEIYDLPDSAQHHVIDKNIMNASNDLLHTAIICPPDIYGQNTGLGSRATFLVPDYVKVLLERKQAFYLGAGENMRAITHINDVVDLFLILLDQAIKGGGTAQWGKEVCL